MGGGYATGGGGGAGSGGAGVSFGPTREQFDALFEEVSKLKLQFATLQEQRRSVGDEWITVYVGIDADDGPVLFSESEALEYLRIEIYQTTKAPYLRRWQRDPSDGEWQIMEEEWEAD